VCNHPELFERADVVAPFSFAQFGQSGPLNREGDFINLPYSTRNPIEYTIPRLFYQDGGLLDVANENSRGLSPLSRLMNIWSTDWMHHSLYADGERISCESYRLSAHFFKSQKVLLSSAYLIYPLLKRILFISRHSFAEDFSPLKKTWKMVLVMRRFLLHLTYIGTHSKMQGCGVCG
jgi:hypothetical protein